MKQALVGVVLVLMLALLGVAVVELAAINSTVQRAFPGPTAYPCASGTSVNGYPCVNGSAGP